MSNKKVPCSLAGIEFDCTVSRGKSLSAEIPQYPIEGGFKTSDTIIRNPIQLDCTAIVTETPVTWRSTHKGGNRVQAVSDKLEQLFFSGELVTFVTPDKVYENMGIQSLNINKGEYANSVAISFSLLQVTVTTADTVQLSPDYEQGVASGSDAGTTNGTEEQSTQKKTSIFKKIWNWVTGKK